MGPPCGSGRGAPHGATSLGVAGSKHYDRGVAPAQIFSVIIPTLQRSRELPELVELCAVHPTVLEVIVVNNHPDPLDFGRENVRVLQQERNIYVNPAWNLGVREARAEYLAIINDDVLFDPALLDLAARAVTAPFTGLVGIDPLHMNRAESLPPKIRLASHHLICSGFGMFMCMPKSNYVPIPEEMKIWGGDDVLYMSQRWPNKVIMGPWIRSEVGTTSSDATFSPFLEHDGRICERYLRDEVGWRWWHRPEEWVLAIRRLRHRLAGRGGRVRHLDPAGGEQAPGTEVG